MSSSRKTTRSGSLKSVASSLASADSPTPVEAPPTKNAHTAVGKNEKTLRKMKTGPNPINVTPVAGSPVGTQVAPPNNNNTGGSNDVVAFINQQMEELRNMLVNSHQQMVSRLEEMQRQNDGRFAKIEAEFENFVPAVDKRFGEVEQRIVDDETSSSASIVELQKVQEYLQQEVQAGKGKEAAVSQELQQIETYLGETQEKEKKYQEELQVKGQEIHKIEAYLEENREKEQIYRRELEEKIEKLIAVNQSQQKEIERLELIAWGPQRDSQASISRPAPPPIETRRYSQGSQHQQPPQTAPGSAMEGVVMTDAYPLEYERGIPCFDGETGDVESFLDRLNRYFGRHRAYYQSEPSAMVYFIADHLEGTAKKWYMMDEVYKQRDDPQPQKLMERLQKEFKSERTLVEVKTAMLKLKHEWGKAYEYLSEFNRLSRILQLTDSTKRLVLMQQVRPSIREEFYDLPAEKQTLEGYVECLRRCDTFPADYKNENLEKFESHRERKIAIMALLGMVDPRRPSKDLEARRRRSGDSRRGDRNNLGRRDQGRTPHPDNKNDNSNRVDGKSYSAKPGFKPKSYQDSRTSSNNPIPKTALLTQDGPEYERFVPEAMISNLRTSEGLQNLNVLYDTGSQINMIHPQLAKEMGFQIEDRPSSFTTAAGKVLIPQVTEEFQIKVKLVEESTNKVRWYDFKTRCRLAEAMPRTIILGSRFMDRHLIYRKVDTRDLQPKVYKIAGEKPGLPDVDTPGECEGDSIYMVQAEEKDNVKEDVAIPPARITQLISKVIDNQKIKDTIYDLTKQFYQERGIEYAGDYYDYLIDYDK